MAIVKRENLKGISYHVRLRDSDGTWFPAKTFTNKNDARKYESELLAAKSKGSRAPTQDAKEMLFCDYWEKWKDLCRGKVSVGWKISQDQMYRDHITPSLGKKKLIEISRKDVAEVLAKAEQKGLGPQTRILVYALMHKMFSDSIEIFEFRETNPAVRKLRPDPPVVERNFLKTEEAWRFLESVKGSHYGQAFWIMILCGLRIGEVQGLQWKGVDLASGILFVERQWSRKEKAFKGLKNGKPIRLPMPDQLTDYLASTKPLEATSESFVCPNLSGGMLSYDTIEDALRRHCKEAQVKQLTLHELRHTSTEIWSEMGASVRDLSRLLNHSNEASTRTYLHKTDERLGSIAKAISKRPNTNLRVIK